MKPTTTAKLRSLTTMELDQRVLIPKFLELLHGQIASYTNLYNWFDEKRNAIDGYAENPDSLKALPLYIGKYHNSLEKEVWRGADTLDCAKTIKVEQGWIVDRREFMKHGFYNEILRPGKFNHGIQRRICVNRRVHGVINMHRTVREPEFSSEEMLRLDQCVKHLEYALSIPIERPSNSNSTLLANTALVMVDLTGKVLEYSANAEQLLMLSQQDDLSLTDRIATFSSLTSICKLLLARLIDLSEGKRNHLPWIESYNAWGHFRISAYFMKSAYSTSVDPHVAIRIEHLLPSQLLLLENIDRHKLTQRQQDVCIQIGMNKSYDEIALNLGVAVSTVVSHKKEIFKRLNIRQRAELIDALLYG